MTKKEQEEEYKKVKESFNLDELRPITTNKVINKYGYLTVGEYETPQSWNGERKFLYPNENINCLHRRWINGEADSVITDIVCHGNDIRKFKEIGYCLIEIIDANGFTKDEFDVILNNCIHIAKATDELYNSIKTAILNEIKKSEETLTAWSWLSSVFSKRMHLEEWQGDLQPYKIRTGKTRQEEGFENMIKSILDNKY